MNKANNNFDPYFPFLLTALIIFLLFLSSCTYEHRLAKWCARCPIKETIKDSLGAPKIIEVPYDTLALISRHQGKEMTFNNCDSLYAVLAAHHGTITELQDGVKEIITGNPGKKISFRCETDSLKEVIRLLRSRVEQPHYITITKEVAARCELEHRNSWDGWCRWWFWISLWVIVVFGLFLRFRH